MVSNFVVLLRRLVISRVISASSLYIYIYIYIYIAASSIEFQEILRHYFKRNRAIGRMSKVFAIGPGDRGSIPGRLIPKSQEMVLDAALLNTQHYKIRIKWSNPGNGVAPSPTPQCRTYWKGSLRAILDFGSCRQLYLLISNWASQPLKIEYENQKEMKQCSTLLPWTGSNIFNVMTCPFK